MNINEKDGCARADGKEQLVTDVRVLSASGLKKRRLRTASIFFPARHPHRVCRQMSHLLQRTLCFSFLSDNDRFMQQLLSNVRWRKKRRRTRGGERYSAAKVVSLH